MIQHLLFDCHYAKFICTSVHIAFNIQKSSSVLHLFDDWANAGDVMGEVTVDMCCRLSLGIVDKSK
jgi:hypothetical protein